MGASNFQGLGIPKPPPRWQEKAKKLAAASKLQREVYAAVDRRDGTACRVCYKRVGGLSMVTAREHHHLIPRSQGGEHSTVNVLSLCKPCHLAEHDGRIRLSGNADTRSQVGVLDGVKLETLKDDNWVVTGWR